MGKKNEKKARRAAAAVADADAEVAKAVAPAARTWPVRLLAWASELGDQPQLRLLCGGAIVAGVMTRNERLARAGVRALAAHEAATAAKNFVKHRVDRARPRSFLGNRSPASHKPKPGRNQGKEETSFPSGHSAGASSVARAFARDYPEYAAAAYGTAGLVALAQIPRSAHYPTDVGAGIAVGLAAEAAVSTLLPRPLVEE
jgi:undecaprenyl-diphosphatase